MMFSQIAEGFCRPWEYFRNRSKYFVGRESTPSCSILFFVGCCSTPFRSIENSVGCHDTCAYRESTPSAVKILAHYEEVFLLDVRVHKHRVNEKSSFLGCVFRNRGAKLRIILGIFAKMCPPTCEFNKSFDNVLSFTTPKNDNFKVSEYPCAWRQRNMDPHRRLRQKI